MQLISVQGVLSSKFVEFEKIDKFNSYLIQVCVLFTQMDVGIKLQEEL